MGNRLCSICIVASYCFKFTIFAGCYSNLICQGISKWKYTTITSCQWFGSSQGGIGGGRDQQEEKSLWIVSTIGCRPENSSTWPYTDNGIIQVAILKYFHTTIITRFLKYVKNTKAKTVGIVVYSVSGS